MIEVLISPFVYGIMAGLVMAIILILGMELKAKRRWNKNQSIFKDPIPYSERNMFKRVIPKSIIRNK